MMAVYLTGAQNDAWQSERDSVPPDTSCPRASTEATITSYSNTKALKLPLPWQQSAQCFLVNLPHQGGPVRPG